MRTESEPPCGSPVVSGDPKEDHNYSSAKSSNARSTSPTSDSISSSSSADDHYEFATKGSQEGSEGSFQSHESHSETEEDDRKPSQKEAKDALGDSGYASQHKKRQHFAKARKVPSDTLPLKKRRTEKPPESDDEEMKEAAGSLLHLAGIRSCLNNITNRAAKGKVASGWVLWKWLAEDACTRNGQVRLREEQTTLWNERSNYAQGR